MTLKILPQGNKMENTGRRINSGEGIVHSI